MTREYIENCLQKTTGCCNICRWDSPEYDYKFIIPVSDVIPWLFHYEMSKSGNLVVHNETEGLQSLTKRIKREVINKQPSYISTGTKNVVIEYSEQINPTDINQITEAFTKLYSVVNPIIQSFLEDATKSDVWDDVKRIKELEKTKLPYNINIIEELHANENAHTRILLKLLNYSFRGDYSILKSFFNYINLPVDFNYEKTVIHFNVNYIDGYISDKKYGIIIENKINGAVDQDAQIERYIETVKSYPIEQENIYVVYLTDTEYKIISDSSLTDNAKKYLDYFDSHNTGRFYTINYQQHILPWLKKDVFPFCHMKDVTLISALNQYIDYLEGRFSLRKLEYDMNLKIQNIMKEKLHLNGNAVENYQEINQYLADTSDYLNGLRSIKRDYIDKAIKSIIEISKNYFSDLFGKSPAIEQRIGDVDVLIQIYNDEWSRCYHLEWYPLKADDLFKENSSFSLKFHNEDKNHSISIKDFKELTKGDLDERTLKMLATSGTQDTWEWLSITEMCPTPFALMTENEKRIFIEQFYNNVKNFVEVFNKYYPQLIK